MCTKTEIINDYFNLIEKPWIKVQTRKGDTIVSLKFLFMNADVLIKLCNDNIFIDVAIYNLIKSIVYTAYNHDSNHKKDTVLIYDSSIVLKYLEENKHLFNLFDPERPFLQIPENKIKQLSLQNLDDFKKLGDKFGFRDSTKSVKGLNLIDSSDNKNNIWSGDSFYWTKENYKKEGKYDDEYSGWIARNFIGYRIYHPVINGSPTIRNSDFSNITPIFFHYKTLKDFIELNCIKPRAFSKITLHPDWEIDYTKEFYEKNIDNGFIEKDEKDAKVYYFNLCPDSKKLDIARFLTYSNTFFLLNRECMEFKLCAGIQLKIVIEENKKEAIIDGISSYFPSILNDSKLSIASLAKKVLPFLQDINTENKRVCYIEAVKPWEGNKGSCVQKWELPLQFLGNGILRNNEEEKEWKTLYSSYEDLLETLEQIENNFNRSVDDVLLCKTVFPYLSKPMKYKEIKNIKDVSLDIIKKDISDMLCLLCNKYKDWRGLPLEIKPNFESDKNLILGKAKNSFQGLFVSIIEKYANSYFYRGLGKEKYSFIGRGNMYSAEQEKIFSNTASIINTILSKNDKKSITLLSEGETLVSSLLTMDSSNFKDYTVFGRISGNTVSNYKNKLFEDSMYDALYLWANHQKALSDTKKVFEYSGKDDSNEDKEQKREDYKRSFGYVLFTIYNYYRRTGQLGRWDNKMSMFENLNARNIKNLKSFMRLCICEAVSINPNIQLSYGKLAYFFQKMRENRKNFELFKIDYIRGFLEARNKEEIKSTQHS